jgi:hypothetical protein
MNLWVLFPESILRVSGILKLPYIALLLLLLLLLVAWKKKQIKPFLMFISAVFLLDLYVLFTIGPGMGRIAIPLILISIVVTPVMLGLVAWLKKDKNSTLFWGAGSCFALVHSMSWAVWIMALAGS